MPKLFFRDWTEVYGEQLLYRRWVFLTDDGYTVGTLLDHQGHRSADARYEWIINSNGRPMGSSMVGNAASVSRAKLDFAKAFRAWLEATGKDEDWRPTQSDPLDYETRRRLRITGSD